MDMILERARAAMADGRHDDAIASFREALSHATTSERREALLQELAEAFEAMGNTAEALAALKEILDFNEHSAAAWNSVGLICSSLQRHEDARRAFEQAARLQPDNAELFINMGSISLKLGDPGNALEYLRTAIELAPAHPVSHANLAITLALFGRLEEAEDALRLAVLYGFAQAEPIQQRIDALKAVRDSVTRGETDTAPSEEEALNDESGVDALVLAEIEKDMYALAEQRYAVQPPDDTLAPRMALLRAQIRLLRRKLGMEEILESDIVHGINYMRDEE